MYVEPLITKSKQDTTHSRRRFQLSEKQGGRGRTVPRSGSKIADRPGGYCRILKTGFRLGRRCRDVPDRVG
ncbi:MAG: L17 family ribosomal protein [Alistipes finegoldii]